MPVKNIPTVNINISSIQNFLLMMYSNYLLFNVTELLLYKIIMFSKNTGQCLIMPLYGIYSNISILNKSKISIINTILFASRMLC